MNIDIRLRPIRFAFLVRPNDAKRVHDALRINACLWGGWYNPIIPYFRQLPRWWDKRGHKFESPKQILNGYLYFFEPDFIVEAEKGLARGLGYPKDRVLRFSDVLKHGGGHGRDGYGLSNNDLYSHLYKTEFQFSKREKDNFVYVTSDEKKITPFISCVFGDFPKEKRLKHYKDNYKYVFRPVEIPLTGKSLADLYDKRHVTPLKIGRETLDVNYNDERDPSLFILDGHEPRDLIDFWNLRIVRKNILAIPKQFIKELSPFCKKFILRHYRPLPSNPNGVMIHPTVMFSRSIAEKEGEQLHKKYISVKKKGANCIQVWYPPLWRPSAEFTVRTTRPTITANEKQVEISTDLDKPVIKFDTLWPEFTQKYGSEFQLANVVKIKGWDDNDQIATTFPCDSRNPTYPKYRLGTDHLLPTSEGLVIFPKHKSIPERWKLESGTEAINKWLNGNKVSAQLSSAGRATQQIIQKLDGFWGVGKIANSGIIRLLDEMARKPITRSMQYKEFSQKIKDALGKNTWKYKEFETLVERGAVELGLELKCTKCACWGWYSIKQLDYALTCELCLQKFNFPITKPGSPLACKWAYRVVGPFALPNYADGGYASAIAIRFFSEMIGRMDVGVTWSAGQELVLAKDKKVEADFILWYQRKQMFATDYPTEVVFGEAKSFGKDVFKQDEIDRAKSLAQTFPGTILVFATMKDGSELSKAEIARLRKLADWGREYDKAKDQTRAAVIILTGTELFSDFSLEQSWREKGGQHAQLVSPGWVRVENLRVLADLTQQLYLGMPSYGVWSENKWKKRRSRRKQATAQ